jgi:hypothetical protein
MALWSYVVQNVYRLTTVLVHPEAHPSDTRGCAPVQEAILLGLCLSRFGGLEARLYDAVMHRIESSPREPVPIASQRSSAACTAQALGADNR